MMRPDDHPHEDPRPHGRRADDAAAERSAGVEHAPGHGAALRTLLELERGDTARAQGIVDGCQQCADELSKLADLRHLLDEAGASQRATLGRARRQSESGQSAPGVELVAPFLRERLAGLQPRRSRLRLVAPLAAVAAALLVMVGWLVRSWFPRNETPGAGVLLGDHSDDGLSPSGEVTEYVPFRWPKLPLPAGGRYRFRVWDALEDDPQHSLISMEIEEDDPWIDPATRASWPDAIGWDVQAQDATGVALGARLNAYARRVKR